MTIKTSTWNGRANIVSTSSSSSSSSSSPLVTITSSGEGDVVTPLSSASSSPSSSSTASNESSSSSSSYATSQLESSSWFSSNWSSSATSSSSSAPTNAYDPSSIKLKTNTQSQDFSFASRRMDNNIDRLTIETNELNESRTKSTTTNYTNTLLTSRHQSTQLLTSSSSSSVAAATTAVSFGLYQRKVAGDDNNENFGTSLNSTRTRHDNNNNNNNNDDYCYDRKRSSTLSSWTFVGTNGFKTIKSTIKSTLQQRRQNFYNTRLQQLVSSRLLPFIITLVLLLPALLIIYWIDDPTSNNITRLSGNSDINLINGNNNRNLINSNNISTANHNQQHDRWPNLKQQQQQQQQQSAVLSNVHKSSFPAVVGLPEWPQIPETNFIVRNNEHGNNNNNNNTEDNDDDNYLNLQSSHLTQFQLYKKHFSGRLLERIDYYLEPDYGGLAIQSMLYAKRFTRRINIADDYYSAATYRVKLINEWDKIHISKRHDFFDDITHTDNLNECLRPQWTYSYYHTCNEIHSLFDPALTTPTLSNDHDDNHHHHHQTHHTKTRNLKRLRQDKYEAPDISIPTVEYLAHGYYRDTWVFKPNYIEDDDSKEYVFKHLRMWHDQDIESLEKIKIEALIMERLTASPVVANIYGHCGTSTMVEKANELTNDIVPYNKDYMMSRGRMKQKYLDQLEKDNDGKPYSMNNLTVEQKLDIAISMAMGMAEHHGYKESVIVNDDAHPDQWLVTDDGRYIFNDMNNAVFLKWNFYKQEYCKFYTTYGGDYRAPEEVSEDGAYVDESVDIWPMGNLILSLLTGLWPYYTLPKEHDVVDIITQKDAPYPPFNPKFATNSYIEHQLVEIMKACHHFDPANRISIFDVLQRLQETKRIYEQTHGKMTKTLIQHHTPKTEYLYAQV